MKSYINILADYRKAPFEKDVVIRCSEEHIRAQMKHLTRAGKKSEAVSVIEKGDVVVLSLESEIEKFNRPTVFMTIGSGLFDSDFEKMLIGRNSGEAFDLTVQGKAVKVTVKQVTRTVFPAPTDEMALQYGREHDDFEGIKTVEDYRNRVAELYIETQKEDTIYGTMNRIIEYVLSNSDWQFDDDEIKEAVEEEKEYIEQELKQENPDKTLKDLSEEEAQKYFDVSSLEEMEEIIAEGAEQRIATALWAASVKGLDSKNASVSELEKKLDWDFLEEFVKENIKITEER